MNKLKVLVLFMVALAVASCAGGKQDPKNQLPTPNSISKEDNNSNSQSVKLKMSDIGKAEAESGKKVNFVKVSTIYFGFDKDKITEEQAKKLNDQSNWLVANVNATVTIEGHTDYVGTSEYNLALGERRANATKEYLISRGIDPKRITTVSYGKDNPANPGQSAGARAENRRTVTVR